MTYIISESEYIRRRLRFREEFEPKTYYIGIEQLYDVLANVKQDPPGIDHHYILKAI